MRVVIAEDGILRKLIAQMLTDGGHDVVYAARTGDELLAFLSRAEPPDVAVLDIRMPPTHTDEGLVTAERIREKWPAVGILLFSTYTLVPMAERLLALGGNGGLGYLSKDGVEDGAELSQAVRRVGERERVMDPQLVRDLLARRRDKPLDELLTDRELAVLRLIAEGRANKTIADTLFVSVKTVEDHSRSLFGKLGVAPAPGYNQRVLAVLEWLRRSG
jgi:DNA-binding NarL/FixJ family response regulator